jgi:ribosomal protein S3
VAVALVLGPRLREAAARGSRAASTLKKRFAHAGVSKIETERAANKLKIDIYTSRPGIIIGRKGRKSTS